MAQEEQKKRAKRVKPDLPTTLDALKNGEDSKISSTIYYGLSGVKPSDLPQIQPIWDDLSSNYRQKVMRRLVDVAEANPKLDYRVLAAVGLEDNDPFVREAAIDLRFADESIAYMDRLIELAQWDDAPSVRAAACSALGRFILGGELGEIDESETVRAQDAMVMILTNEDEDIDVRRRALEAIANCGHEIVDEAINDAYEGYDRRMRVSAVFAMGRTCDDKWGTQVLRELESDDPEMRYEAARAAGELELVEGVAQLVRLAHDSDREVKEVAIWSLGEIGGRDAERALSALARQAAENSDKELLEAVEDAIASASVAGNDLFDLRMLDD